MLFHSRQNIGFYQALSFTATKHQPSTHITWECAHIKCDQLEIIRLLLTLTANKAGGFKAESNG
jgi:hypothetical protein